MEKNHLKIILASPRGFCAGVVRAIDIVDRALQVSGSPVHVRHEIVHNRNVVEDLREKGAVFVDEVDDIPVGSVAVFSAHGVSRRVEDDSRRRGLQVIDATCPLVTKVHNEAGRYSRQGYEIILIGHEGHPEVEGTLGRIDGPVTLISTVDDARRLNPGDPSRLAYVTQTTLSVSDTRDIVAELKHRFPAIVGPNAADICYATQNRQNAVRQLALFCDLILVIGAANSSNSNRLREVGENMGVSSYLIPDAGAIQPDWLRDAKTVGVTAGASAPEHLVQQVVDELAKSFETSVEEMDGVKETTSFRLPRALERAEPMRSKAAG